MYRGFPRDTKPAEKPVPCKKGKDGCDVQISSGKRIKPGLAITQRHIRLCDGHLRAAGVSSRNEFVEKAIECYVGWLDVKQNPEFFSRFDARDFSGWQV